MMLITDDLDQLLEILPDFVKLPLLIHPKRDFLLEIIMDLGRKPEARFPEGPEYLSFKVVVWQDLDYCIRRLGNFSGDNRSGIERTLHRISSIKNRQGNIVGLTCRVGRAVFGTISIIRDLLEKTPSLLLLGKPGIGKTTAVREIARILADEMEKRVVIIDTSNEIAGDGDIPHPAIGRARRMQVSRPELQHQVMIEAVENHMPEVIIIDEIGTELEALAARTISERGVQLVGTAHGNYLDSIIKNPVLSDLIGGIQYVTLGDDEAKRRGSQKSILERKAFSAFQVVIEMHERHNWIVHEAVDQAVDQLLQGSRLWTQRRKLNSDGSVVIECEHYMPPNFISNKKNCVSKIESSKYLDIQSLSFCQKNPLSLNALSWLDNCSSYLPEPSLDVHKSICLYVYYIDFFQVKTVVTALRLPIVITKNIIQADIILALRANIKKNTKIKQIAKSRQITIYTIYSGTATNIARALRQICNTNNSLQYSWPKLLGNSRKIELEALIEARIAIEKIVRPRKQSVELLPRLVDLRKLQYKLILCYNLSLRSFGEEPNRRLKIYPD
uniref:R3H domain-containing protein n=1 Tax=Melanthalia intermedia TaxID=172989 RepID=A0A345UAT8_9FLOR|nr:hypothetical protein [Melanthalia intermedia]AXI97574.1 hypothetical protein [Melanthalia intermedia]